MVIIAAMEAQKATKCKCKHQAERLCLSYHQTSFTFQLKIEGFLYYEGLNFVYVSLGNTAIK